MTEVVVHDRKLLDLFVDGLPVAQGSMSGFVVTSKATGKQRAVVTDQKGKKLKPWRGVVRQAAIAARSAGDPAVGPIEVILLFALPRPKAAPKTRRTLPIGRVGDVDKLARAVMDALTDADVWGDDCQVVRLVCEKDYPGPWNGFTEPGVRIVVNRLQLKDIDEGVLL
jgi:Holliday junction resolvase RusA-like endonuclease